MSDDRLNLRPGGLEVLSTGLNLAELDLHGGEGFWEEVARFAGESRIEEQVDAVMSGRSAPRVWAVMESPGSGPGAAAAGLAIARVLADRGQAVVLVDGDEQEPRITRWLGRVEMEGWIDMIRFGASLHAASDPLPSDNRRGSVLGVGSFAPTGVTPDEVTDLLARLRRQADDLVLVLPAKLRSQPWFEASHIRLLSWDLLSRSAGDTEKIVVELDRMGARPDAILGYGLEEFEAIQARLREDAREDGLAPLASEEAAEEPSVPTPPAEPTLPDEEATPVPVSAGETPPGADEPLPPLTAPEEEAPLAGMAVAATPTGKPRRRSSGIFIVAAVVAAVCIVMLGVFLAGQRGETDSDAGPTMAAAQQDQRANDAARGRQTMPASADAGRQAGVPPAADQGGPESAVGEEDRPSNTVGDDAAAGQAAPSQAAPEEAATQPPASPAETTPEPPAGAATVDETAAEPEPEVEDAAAGDELDMAVFRVPVGQDGWALWLYSLPEEALAEKEIRELERRGIRAAYRTVDLEDKGRWYRVYIGSFASRAAAKEAVDGVKRKLKQDWVVPARF